MDLTRGSLACPERSRRDPQLGRFLGVDPLADAQGQQVWSPYAAMGNAPESCVNPSGTTTYTAFSSMIDRFNFTTSLNIMFGATTWKLGENDEVKFTDLTAAKINFENFMASGEGGGCMATGETMAFIGSQILAATRGDGNNITVGWQLMG